MTALNKAITEWDGPHGLPRFEAIRDEDFRAAFDHAMQAHLAEIDAIAQGTAPATFESVIVPLELAGEPLSRVNALFWNRAGANTNDTIKALEREISPALSRHWSAIAQNRKLFDRIDAVWQGHDRKALGEEAFRVLEDHWKGFVKAGAKLDEAGQERLAQINERLASLGTQFGQNVLADETDMGAGTRPSRTTLRACRNSCCEPWPRPPAPMAAKAGWAVTLSRSIIEPFLTFSDRAATCARRPSAPGSPAARGGDTTTARWSPKSLKLRDEKARCSAMQLRRAEARRHHGKDAAGGERTAGAGLGKGAERAAGESAELAAIIAAEGSNHAVEAWDWRHYAEKLRAAEVCLRRGRAEALSAARAHHRRLLRRREPPVRHHLRGRARTLPPGIRTCASSRCCDAGRQGARPVPRRLFRPRLEALRRLDEFVPVAAPARWRAHSRSSTTS